jgi:hypothetical protein
LILAAGGSGFFFMKTKIFLPDNFYSRLFLTEIKPDKEFDVSFLPSPIISKRLNEEQNAVGLIPSIDLLTFKELYVSSRTGISFNALLSNSYLYFKENENSVDELSIAGDVTSNEIVLSKILFRELYNIDIKTRLITQDFLPAEDTSLIVGDKNFLEENFFNGLSFSEEIIELIDAPYVNFLLAGRSEQVLKNFVTRYETNLLDGHNNSFSELQSGFSELANDFIRINLQHVIFDFEDQDLEGIKYLLQLPYFYGIINEMIDVKFV